MRLELMDFPTFMFSTEVATFGETGYWLYYTPILMYLCI